MSRIPLVSYRNDVLGVCAGPVDLESESIHTVKVPKKFYLSQEQCFINLLNGKKDSLCPTVADGIHSQNVLDAIEKSDAEHRWVEI